MDVILDWCEAGECLGCCVPIYLPNRLPVGNTAGFAAWGGEYHGTVSGCA